MAFLSDMKIRALINAGNPFEGIADGGGLYLCWPKGTDGKPRYSSPVWKFRYRFGGKARSMNIGRYGNPTLAEARKTVRQLKARVALGFDPASEKQDRKATGKAKLEAERTARTVATLIDEYLSRYVDGKLKRPESIRQRLDKHIRPVIGPMKVEDVKPVHVDGVLSIIVENGKKRTANDVLHWLKRLFDYAITRHYIDHNPATAFKNADAGGEIKSRDRALSLDETALLLQSIKDSQGFSTVNGYAVRLLLLSVVVK